MFAEPRRRTVFLAAAPAAHRQSWDEAAAAAGLVLAVHHSASALDGVLGVDAEGAVLAASMAERLDLPWHPRSAVETSLDPLRARGRLMAAGLQVPWFFSMPTEATLASVADRIRFPCVVKPLAGPGAVAVGDPSAFETACARLRTQLAAAPDDPQQDLLVEAYIPGDEVSLQGVMTDGALHVLAIDQAIGARDLANSRDEARAIAGMAAHAALALGLRHGPIHATCRVRHDDVVVLGVWPWPIAASAASVRFATREGVAPARDGIALAELLLRHAVGEPLDDFVRLL